MADEVLVEHDNRIAVITRLAQSEAYRTMMAASRRVKGSGTADPGSMAAFLAQLRERHGGGSAFLTAHGMSGSELAALRAALVEQ